MLVLACPEPLGMFSDRPVTFLAKAKNFMAAKKPEVAGGAEGVFGASPFFIRVVVMRCAKFKVNDPINLLFALESQTVICIIEPVKSIGLPA